MSKSAEYSQTWYANNRETQKQRVQARKVAMRQWLNDIKATLKCSRCPEAHPLCLDFHHLEQEKKAFPLGEAINGGWGKERILAEIAKCEVLCANCHRKEHAPA